MIEEELEAAVVSADEEPTPPQVRPPMPRRLDQPDQLPLIRRKLVVAGSKGPAEEGQGAGPLVKNGTETRTGRVAIEDELEVKIWHLKHRPRGKGALECREGLGSLRRPGERLLA